MSFEKPPQGPRTFKGPYEEQSPGEKARRMTGLLHDTLNILLRNQKQEESFGNRLIKFAQGGRGLEPVQSLLDTVRKLLDPLDERLPETSGETEALLRKIDSQEMQKKILSSVGGA